MSKPRILPFLHLQKKHGFWMTEITSKSAEGNSLFTNAVLMILTCIVNNRHQDLSHGFRFGRQSSPRLCAEACKSWGSLPLLSWRPMRVICKHVQMKRCRLLKFCSGFDAFLLLLFKHKLLFISAALIRLPCHMQGSNHTLSIVLISQSWTQTSTVVCLYSWDS